MRSPWISTECERRRMHILRENMPRASEHVVRVHTFRERVMPAHLERKHVESERTRRESAYISRERAKASTHLEGNHFERERRRVHIMIENMSRASDHVLRVHTSRERVMPAHLEISQFDLYSRNHFSTSSQLHVAESACRRLPCGLAMCRMPCRRRHSSMCWRDWQVETSWRRRRSS